MIPSARNLVVLGGSDSYHFCFGFYGTYLICSGDFWNDFYFDATSMMILNEI